VGGVPITDIRKVSAGADLYIIAVKDDTIAEVASQLHLQNELIVHTSGSIHINVLEPASTVYGVFYPLQTFSKNREVNFKDVTLCVEGCTPEVTAKLLSLASQLSGKVVELTSEKRMAIHVAAVFACNFTNFMYALSQKLLADQNLDFELIRPDFGNRRQSSRINACRSPDRSSAEKRCDYHKRTSRFSKKSAELIEVV
jgi:predicted short-subunit dehydrogenase-like oxidoreductase (DUF2520 family)